MRTLKPCKAKKSIKLFCILLAIYLRASTANLTMLLLDRISLNETNYNAIITNQTSSQAFNRRIYIVNLTTLLLAT